MKKLFLLIVLALTGCAAHQMTQHQCLATNWAQMGFQDGSTGRSLQILTEVAQECQRFKIPIDRNGYVAGWNHGIKHYCEPDFNVGVADGKLGKSSTDISDRKATCELAGIPLSLTKYEHGRQVGLRSFCTYEKGVSAAQQGQALPAVCTGHLKAAVERGWNKTAIKFCSDNENAFALGKANKPYPEACPENKFIAFKSEYDRGLVIGTKMGELQAKITDIDARIAQKVSTYDFKKTDKGYLDSYELGPANWAQSDEAIEQLKRLKNLFQMKHDLEA